MKFPPESEITAALSGAAVGINISGRPVTLSVFPGQARRKHRPCTMRNGKSVSLTPSAGTIRDGHTDGRTYGRA